MSFRALSTVVIHPPRRLEYLGKGHETMTTRIQKLHHYHFYLEDNCSLETLLTERMWRNRGYQRSIVWNGCSKRYTLLVARANKQSKIVLRKTRATDNLKNSVLTSYELLWWLVWCHHFGGNTKSLFFLFGTKCPGCHAIGHPHTWPCQITCWTTWFPFAGALIHNCPRWAFHPKKDDALTNPSFENGCDAQP